jgi:hypothetical protein
MYQNLRHAGMWAGAMLGVLACAVVLRPGAAAAGNPDGCFSTSVSLSLGAKFDPDMNGVGDTPVSGFVDEGDRVCFSSSVSHNSATNCGFQNGTLIITDPTAAQTNVTPNGGISLVCNPFFCNPPGMATVTSKETCYTVNAADLQSPTAPQCPGRLPVSVAYSGGVAFFGPDPSDTVAPITGSTVICLTLASDVPPPPLGAPAVSPGALALLSAVLGIAGYRRLRRESTAG